MKQVLTRALSSVLIALVLAAIGCKKETRFMNNAEIIGYDLGMCACCGGTEIIIENVSNPNGKGYFLIDHLPANFILGDDAKFPVAVKIDWTIDTARCFGNYVDISRIEKR